MLIWRDCVGIEPTGDCTSLPEGFEDLGVHQHHNQPRKDLSATDTYFIMLGAENQGGVTG